MIIGAAPEGRSVAWAGALRRLPVPAERRSLLAGDGIQRAGRVTRLLERLERLPAHRSVDVEVQYADDCAELFEHEENRAVMHERAPVAATDEIALLFAQARRREALLGISPER